MNKNNTSRFIFLDPIGKRWTRTRLMVLLLTIVVFVAAVLFVRALFVMPRLTPPAFQARLKALERQALTTRAIKPLWIRFARPASVTPRKPPARDGAEIRLAFTSGWDPNSLRSFERHADQFTHVSPEWFSLVDGLGTLKADPDPAIQKTAAKHGVTLLPLLRNLVDDTWQPEAVESLANGPVERRTLFIQNLIAQLQAVEAGGVVIEWGHVDPSYASKVTSLLEDLANALHAKDLQLWLCVPMGVEFKLLELERLSPAVDRFIAMLHDETGEEDAPGPLASQPWFEGWLDTVTSYGRSSQWVVALGAYGYDWAQGEERAEAIGFADAMSRAGRSGLSHCDYQTDSVNPHFEYEEAGRGHQVWFLDAGTFLNQLRLAQRKEVGGFAVSRLGTEDPTIWDTWRLAKKNPLEASDLSATLGVVPTEEIATHIGQGEFLTIAEDHADGRRRVEQLKTGLVTMQYERFPSYLTVWHQGQGPADAVALSFDDGPDPSWTPRILDILKARGVKAAFFMVGRKMEEHPELVRRVYAEGHEVGVHTYTHADLSQVSDERVRLELNATQRLVEKLTGHSTVLFRPPYKADNRMTKPEDILPIKVAQELGYLTVTNTIDTQDYTRPGADGIMQNLKAARHDGNIILMHDAGGDRRQTIQALPLILDYLYERGDRVIPLSDLLRLPPEQLMPATRPQGQEMVRMFADSGFGVLHVLEELVWAFMIVATVLVVLRTVIIAVLAAGHKIRPNGPAHPATDFHPPVSILLPAYNEAKVIARTLSTLLATDYPGPLEVVVVDDGSKDQTAAIVRETALDDPRLRLICQPNEGKAAALQHGMAAVRYDIVITLDADTQFAPDTIGHLANHFQDKRVAAVSGHVKVGNLRTFIARCQALEYICGFNLERRAYHQLNCITVVPGAVSAWRREAIVAAGGISGDTLAEDTDLTLSFHRSGWRVTYEPRARAWTEAPESIPNLMQQRFRWAFGTLQCLWKHRDLLFQPRYGALALFSLPGVWFFQIVLVAIVPLVDIMLIFSLLFGGGGAIWTFFVVFMLMDLALAVLACGLEGESLRRAWICLPMRLLYRPLLSWVVWKSIFKAIKGVWVGWGKLERTASVAGAQRP